MFFFFILSNTDHLFFVFDAQKSLPNFEEDTTTTTTTTTTIIMNQNNIISNLKCCADCKTTKTPLWRGGPAGPKSLCNACGIRFRKKNRVFEGLKKRSDKKKDKSTNAAAAAEKADDSKAPSCVNGLSDSLKMRLMALGKEVFLQKSSSKSSPSLMLLPSVVVKKQRCQRRRRKLKEEEQAAFSLMALSCGFVFA